MAAIYVDDDYWPINYAQVGITIDWANRIIFIPKAESVLIQSVPMEIRQLDISAFREVLKDLEDDADGMTFPDTHRHNTTVSVGGAVLARVVEMINNYTVTFEDGQYAINLVGANSNIGDVVNVNSVSVRSANSAGLQDLNSLQAASFSNGVTINTTSSYTGTLFPVGTRQFPVNNIADAVQIASNRGIKNINVASGLYLLAGDVATNLRFIGDSVITVMYVDGYADVTGCEFNLLSLAGSFGLGTLVRECSLGDVAFAGGIIYESGLAGTVQIIGASPGILLECFSIAGDEHVLDIPGVDASVIGGNMTIRGYNGVLHIANLTNDVTISLDFDAGILHVLPSCTSGTIIVTGNAEVQSEGTSVIIDKTIQASIPANTWNRSIGNISTPGSVGEKIRKNLLR